MKCILKFTLLLLGLNLSAQTTDLNTDLFKSKISELAIQELENSRAPSLQIAISLEDSLIFNEAFGLADIENNVPATNKTKYRTASVSKLWTSTVAMMLVDKGLLNLDEPIRNYCPNFPKKEHVITTRQLLTHTSGIRSYMDLEEELKNAENSQDSLDIKNRYRQEMLGEFTRYTEIIKALDNFKNDPLIFEPGTDWHYSSQAYRVLGCVLEGASNLTYQQLTKQYIFEPTSMNNTLEDDAWAIIPNRASGYRINGEKPIRRADMRDVSENLPAGGHLTTASDLILFANSFLNEEYFSSGKIKLMSENYIKSVESNNKKIPLWRYAIPNKENYGYGIMIFPSEDTKRFGHTGRQAGGSAILIMIPEKKLSIAVLTNVKGWNGYISFPKKIEEVISQM
ncbi:beta-lactamase family protein [Polaribacter batillariae]|uniref:Beta-lactamase family protein n=1 Tax=Polaribacter batillariae TaxID=2808900 RepID=A0ABX7SX49_9FLAO|nr:serine hydrolase domain-containing protein [Polaribacter batillariae]QTD38076.1 beta-lactamase family protein [Polaribacter batillariae]